MSRRIIILVGFLISSCFFPVNAQDNEYERWSYNLGGGVGVPLNPTGRYVGPDGNFTTGAGVNFNPHNGIEGDFLWNGLSPAVSVTTPVNGPNGSVNVLSFTGEYRWHYDDIAHSIFGVYVLAGGGYYHRGVDISKSFVAPPLTVCQPLYYFWGFRCTSAGVVDTTVSGGRGSGSGGANAGFGFTVSIGDGWKLFAEARYTYVFSPYVPTTFIPVTFGFRFN